MMADSLSVAEVLVRKVPDDQRSIDLRVAVLGNVDVGKSTLIGVLTQGQLDNGRGLARLNMFRHKHEFQTGRTSCVSHEILGFDPSGHVINYSESTTGFFFFLTQMLTFERQMLTKVIFSFLKNQHCHIILLISSKYTQKPSGFLINY